MTQIAQITQKMAKLFSASESSEKSVFAFVPAIEADRGRRAKPTRSTIQNHSSPRNDASTSLRPDNDHARRRALDRCCVPHRRARDAGRRVCAAGALQPL